VGDGTVGKTAMLMSYICQAFTQDYVPTMFDNFSAIETVDGELVNVILWDTAGQEDYETIRTKTCFPDTHIFIICFSVVHPDSFLNVKQKWLEELKRAAPDTPFILVGTKSDLRDDAEVVKKLTEKGKAPVTTKEGKKRQKEIKAEAYLECSAKDLKSVNEIFLSALKVVMDPIKFERERIAKLAKKENALEAKEEAKQKKKRRKVEKKRGRIKEKGGREKTQRRRT